MAERRMLWKRVSLSRKVNQLSLKATLLWTWTQPHLDPEGYIEAEADYLKAVVVPKRKEIKEAEIPNLRQEIIDIGLWEPYSYDGVMVIQEKSFNDYQTLARKEDGTPRDETPSFFSGKLTTWGTHGKHKGTHVEPKVNIKLSKDKLSKDKYKDCVFLSQNEYNKLLDKYGERVTQEAIERLNNYKMSNGKKYKSDYHAILNWVVGDIEKRRGGRKPLGGVQDA